ncbi:MAG: polymerase, sigma-24 subunit, subfamily [Frankiales bacterium]|nr:polymerase, sigma-24 subunit, subfamily [Frankiales bacterium]
MKASDSEFHELYAASYARLVGILTLGAADRSEAEEVVQEAFLQLISRWGTVSTYDDPEAWVRAVAFRRLSNRHRRGRLSQRVFRRLEQPREPRPSSTEPVDVVRALAALPLAQRKVIVLHHLLDWSVERVAAELGIPVGTVKSRLSRGRAALLPLLESEVIDHA